MPATAQQRGPSGEEPADEDETEETEAPSAVQAGTGGFGGGMPLGVLVAMLVGLAMTVGGAVQARRRWVVRRTRAPAECGGAFPNRAVYRASLRFQALVDLLAGDEQSRRWCAWHIGAMDRFDQLGLADPAPWFCIRGQGELHV